jgi:hypothetical protein
MSIKTYYLEGAAATAAARAFRAAGYRATRNSCTGYVCTVVAHHAGGDLDAQAELMRLLGEVL